MRFHRLDETVPTSPKPEPRAKKQPAQASKQQKQISTGMMPKTSALCARSDAVRLWRRARPAVAEGGAEGSVSARTSAFSSSVMGSTMSWKTCLEKVRWRNSCVVVYLLRGIFMSTWGVLPAVFRPLRTVFPDLGAGFLNLAGKTEGTAKKWGKNGERWARNGLKRVGAS